MHDFRLLVYISQTIFDPCSPTLARRRYFADAASPSSLSLERLYRPDETVFYSYRDGSVKCV
jgi:hypothetical protein